MPQVTPKIKAQRRIRRKHHIRKRVRGSPEKPRLSIFRSLGHIYGQLVDDLAGRTLCAASTLDEDVRGTLKAKGNVLAATAVGSKLAEKAKSAGITRIVFDRNGFRYHGRVKALADAARKGGLQF